MNDLIEKLSDLRSQFNCFDENERDAYSTLSEAIKVISEQPKPCEDAVSRHAAIDAFGDVHPLDYNAQAYLSKIKALPSAQPEIVRCKDCKHRASYWGNCRLLEEKYHQSVLVDGNSFCSMAERRTDETD